MDFIATKKAKIATTLGKFIASKAAKKLDDRKIWAHAEYVIEPK